MQIREQFRDWWHDNRYYNIEVPERSVEGFPPLTSVKLRHGALLELERTDKTYRLGPDPKDSQSKALQEYPPIYPSVHVKLETRSPSNYSLPLEFIAPPETVFLWHPHSWHEWVTTHKENLICLPSKPEELARSLVPLLYAIGKLWSAHDKKFGPLLKTAKKTTRDAINQMIAYQQPVDLTDEQRKNFDHLIRHEKHAAWFAVSMLSMLKKDGINLMPKVPDHQFDEVLVEELSNARVAQYPDPVLSPKREVLLASLSGDGAADTMPSIIHTKEEIGEWMKGESGGIELLYGLAAKRNELLKRVCMHRQAFQSSPQ